MCAIFVKRASLQNRMSKFTLNKFYEIDRSYGDTQANAESLGKNITSLCGFYRDDHALASGWPVDYEKITHFFEK